MVKVVLLQNYFDFSNEIKNIFKKISENARNFAGEESERHSITSISI